MGSVTQDSRDGWRYRFVSSTQRWVSLKEEVSSEEDKEEQGLQTDTCIRGMEEGGEFKKKEKNSLINRNGSRTDANGGGNFSRCGRRQRGQRE